MGFYCIQQIKVHMLLGVDTSGKIGQGNLYIAIVKHRDSDFMKLLREKIRKRNKAIASRRRIKASSLNKEELLWVAKNFDTYFTCSVLTISDFSKLRKELMSISNWKFKILSCVIYVTCRDKVKSNDVLLIDRDYSHNMMKRIFEYLKFFFKLSKKNIIAESGDSFNETIAKADLIAGCGRNKIITPTKLSTGKIKRLVKLLK